MKDALEELLIYLMRIANGQPICRTFDTYAQYSYAHFSFNSSSTLGNIELKTVIVIINTKEPSAK